MVTRAVASYLVLSCIAGSIRGQESNAQFHAPLVVAGDQSRLQKLGDINGDGFVDAVSGWWTDSSIDQIDISVFLNDGSGNLFKAWTISTIPSPANFTAWRFDCGDVDGDGRDDIVVASGTHGWLYLTRPDGLGSTSAGSFVGMFGATITGVLLVDLDADDIKEVAILAGRLQIMRWTAPSSLQQVANMQLNANGGELRVADVDGVGSPDILAWDATRILLVPMIGLQPQPPLSFLHGCTTPKGAAGDIDGDGDDDVVVFDTGTYVLLRRSAQGHALEGPFAGGPARFLVDIDQDGDLDGVCCGSGGPTSIYNDNESIFRIAVNDGQGAFAPSLEFPGLGSERMAGAVDLDHDGDLDIVAGRCIYYGESNFLAGVPRKLPFAPCINAIADLEGDADCDLEVGLSTQRSLGDGSFLPFTPVVPAPPAGRTWHGPGFPGDFDADGDVDLVVLQRQGGAFEQMQLLLNSGGGSFVDAGAAAPAGLDFTYAWQPDPRARDAIAQDADGDGDVDLIVTGAPQFESKLFWNDGQGSFSAGPAWNNSFLVQRVADMNADGLPDLLGYDRWMPTMTLLAVVRGLGNGAFDGPAHVINSLLTASAAESVFDVGDADNDGDLDLVLANPQQVHVIWNDGSPTYGFSTSQQVVGFAGGSEGGPRGALFVDGDGDALLDVIAWPATSGTLHAPNASFYARRKPSNDGYEAPILQVLLPKASHDVDGDGDEDLLARNVHKNRAFEGTSGGVRKQVHNGHPGAGGVTPTLGARGPFRVGEPVELMLSGATGGISGWFHQRYVSDAPPVFTSGYTNFQQRSLAAHPTPLVTSGALGAVGAGRWNLPFNVPEYVGGRTKLYFIELQDPYVPSGRARSNDLRVTYGP